MDACQGVSRRESVGPAPERVQETGIAAVRRAETMTQPELARLSPYGIAIHQHRFAAWVASRAASVKNCRFGVEQGRTLLEACGFTPSLSRPDQLPEPERGAVDDAHRRWRMDVMRAAQSSGLRFSHGVAAKPINVYLKSRFVCGGHDAHARVQSLHPPIDSVLLKGLADANVGGHATVWRQAAKMRWSRFNSDDYERVIGFVRQSMAGAPMWKIEEFWRGNQ